MPWFAIRTIYQFGVKTDGKNVFEERVVCFSGDTWQAAQIRAKAEALSYEKVNKVTAHIEQIGYEQDGENLIDEYELWSELFESTAELDEFYECRYGQYKYHPDPPVTKPIPSQ